MYGLRYNRPFIHGRQVELVTDSEPLTYLLKQTNSSTRNARWLAILSEYHITHIDHISGVSNVVPDVLSRMSSVLESEIVDSLPWVNSVSTRITNKAVANQNSKSSGGPSSANQNLVSKERNISTGITNRAAANQKSSLEAHVMADEEGSNDIMELIRQQHKFGPYESIISYLQGKSGTVPRNTGLKLDRFSMYEDLLCIRSSNAYGNVYNRICVPPTLVRKVLETAHVVTGHCGVRRMYEYIRLHSWWKTMLKDIKTFCNLCQICKKNKVYNAPQIPILTHPEVSSI